MKKSILNLGKTIDKNQQKSINGGISFGNYYCNEGGRALVACINGELLGYCRNIQGAIYTIAFGTCF